MMKHHSSLKKIIFFVQGMHCASCEVVIEKKLLSFKNIHFADAHLAKNQVDISYSGKKPDIELLNKTFFKYGYQFSYQPFPIKQTKIRAWKYLLIALGVIVLFILLEKSGLTSFMAVNESSSLVAFFIFGILAGLSSCAALVGGLILSMSKRWYELYANSNSFWEKYKPHLLFNSGRLLSYAFFGALLGALGSKMQISLNFTAILVILVSIIMIFLALKMLGIESLKRFSVQLPKFITHKIADEKNFQGKIMPFILGALTFFLPCGFTITAQGIALISANAISGAIIMFFFALGTFPILLMIGLTSVKFIQKPHLSSIFLKVAGILILFFALYNINSQLNVLNLPSLSNIYPIYNSDDGENIEIVKDSGIQVIKMDAYSFKYSPNFFQVKVDVPVRWEITNKGVSGCTNAIISPKLFDEAVPISQKRTSVIEFTPHKTGKYKFSCWMGMVSGIIEVVD
jgi:sulfite exporter TauE/SafE/copper chaperone CopZ/plastocyanin